MRDISHILNVYLFGELQDLVTLMKRMEEYNITPKELYEYVDEKKKELLEKARIEAIEKTQLDEEYETYATKCPHCGKVMRLGIAEGGGSHWWCKDCAFGIYSPLCVRDELKRAYDERV